MPWETSQVPKKVNDSWMIAYEDKEQQIAEVHPAGSLGKLWLH